MQKKIIGFPENFVVRVTTELEWCNVVATFLNLGYRWMHGDQGINLHTEYFQEYYYKNREFIFIYYVSEQIIKGGIFPPTRQGRKLPIISSQEFLKNIVKGKRIVRRIIIRNK